MTAAALATRLLELASHRVLVLDGAMGTMIQRERLQEADFRGERFASHPHDLKGNNDLLLLTRPDVIAAIHDATSQAGADIIETNTFNATAIAQADYGLEDVVYEMNLAGARLAAAAAENGPREPRIGRGSWRASIGPTNRTLSISPERERPRLPRRHVRPAARGRYAEQVRGLSRAAATCCWSRRSSTRSTRRPRSSPSTRCRGRRRCACRSCCRSTVADRSGRTLSGQTVDAFWVTVAHARPVSVGLNCALGAREMRPYVAELARVATSLRQPATRTPASRTRSASTTSRPEETARSSASSPRRPREHRRRLLRDDARAHPRRSSRPSRARAAAGAPAGRRTERRLTRFAGLETLTIRPDSNFQMIGERTNVSGSARFRRLIKAGDFAGGRGRRAGAGRGRREHPRREHGRGRARLARRP